MQEHIFKHVLQVRARLRLSPSRSTLDYNLDRIHSSTSARGPRSNTCCTPSSAARRRMGASRSVRRSRSRPLSLFSRVCFAPERRAPALPLTFPATSPSPSLLPFPLAGLPFAWPGFPLARLLRLRHSAPLLLAPRVSIFPLISRLVPKFISRNRNRNQLSFPRCPCPALSSALVADRVLVRACARVPWGRLVTCTPARLHTTGARLALTSALCSTRHNATGARTDADIDIIINVHRRGADTHTTPHDPRPSRPSRDVGTPRARSQGSTG